MQFSQSAKFVDRDAIARACDQVFKEQTRFDLSNKTWVIMRWCIGKPGKTWPLSPSLGSML